MSSAKSHNYASYSRKRDIKASLNEDITDKIICNIFGISENELTKYDGTQEDFAGVDRCIPNGDTIQKKNVVIFGNPKYSHTVTIPCKNYHEYVKNNITWLFHSYYNQNEPKKVRQWVLVRMRTLTDLFDEKRKRNNRKTGTDFYYWPYTTEYRFNQGDPINLLEVCENYSIP